jgi:hypothetical protein
MFNSGVIGVHASDASLLDEVLHLTDQIYLHARFPTIEQLAFSVCLQHATRVRESHDVIRHYWPPALRSPFRENLRRILDKGPSSSPDETFRDLLPWVPRIAVERFQWGGPNMARRLRGRSYVLVRRAAELAGVRGPLRRAMALMHHIWPL